MKFQLTQNQTEKFIEWKNIQSMKGRPSPEIKLPRFVFCFSPNTHNIEVKVIDNLTKDVLELTEY